MTKSDILLTHTPYVWCKKHNKMEVLMNCLETDNLIKKELAK